MNKQKISLLVTSLAFVVAPTFSFAANGYMTPNPTRVAERTENRCTAVTNMVNAHIKNIEARKDVHVEVYKNAHNRWVELAARLKAQGYDTTKLETDLTTLDGMVSLLSTDYQKFVEQTKFTLNIDCLSSRDEFKAQLKTSRDQLASLKADAKKVHDFIMNTIKADLRALRSQKVNTKGEK
jgi:hypothetical protein